MTRLQQERAHRDVVVVPVGIKPDGLPRTILDTFAYAAADICNDGGFGITEELSSNLKKFRRWVFEMVFDA